MIDEAGFRARLFGRRNMYINTSNTHPDAKVAEAMRERANVIELVISDLDTFAKEAREHNK